MTSNDLFAGMFTHLGWAFLPSLATSTLQNVFYSLTVRGGSPRPRPGQPLHAYHRRRIHILVLSLYLLYTLAQTLHDIRLAGDFYTDLGVSFTASEREIRSKFRRLAARHHPDKLRRHEAGADGDATSFTANTGTDAGTVGVGADPGATFIHLKLAHDTLLDPTKRFAYDRFGPVIVKFQQQQDQPTSGATLLKTNRDYVYAGLRALAPEYLKGGLVLLVLNWIWLPRGGQFWRLMTILSLASLELYLLTHDWSISSSPDSSSPDSSSPDSSSPLIYYAAQTLKFILTPLSHIFPSLTSSLTSSSSSSSPPPANLLLPFQLLTLARHLSISLSIFISQLSAPSPPSTQTQTSTESPQQKQQQQHLHAQISQLSQLALRTDAEATTMLDLEMAPFKSVDADADSDTGDNRDQDRYGDGVGPGGQMEEIKRAMKEGIVMSAIRNQPHVKETVDMVLARRRGGGRVMMNNNNKNHVTSPRGEHS